MAQLLKNRYHHVLDKAGLTHCYIRGLPIAEKRDVKPFFFLEVSLCEVLFEQEVCPLDRHIKVSQRGADVTCVKDDTTQRLFVVL